MKYWKEGFYFEQSDTNDRCEISDEYYELLLKQNAEQNKRITTNSFGEPVATDYVETENESAARRICELQKLLKENDYKVLKFAEEEISEVEFALIKAQRKSWRAEINELEARLVQSNF